MTPEIIYEARVYVSGSFADLVIAEKLAKVRNFSFNRYEKYAFRFSANSESLQAEMDKVVESIERANVKVTRSRILNTAVDSKRNDKPKSKLKEAA
jgi:hypothetical protein